MRRTLDDDDACFYLEVGRRLTLARKHAGLTQQGLADLLRCDQSAISKVETGDHNIPLAMFVNLADALNVDPADLLNGGVLA